MATLLTEERATGPGRPREFKTEAVLSAAVKVFWKYGYHASSIDDLCKATGLLRGSLYGAFGDKKGILLAALDYYSEARLARLQERLKKPGKEGLREALMQYARTAGALSGRRACLITNTALEMLPEDKDVHAKVERTFRRMSQVLTAAVVEGQAAGAFSKRLSDRDIGNFVLTVIQGIRVLGKVSYSERELRAVVDIALRVLA
jgi:TetR/AcrR family transcriptional repressor of nem operon